jgi:hypothetical protein
VPFVSAAAASVWRADVVRSRPASLADAEPGDTLSAKLIGSAVSLPCGPRGARVLRRWAAVAGVALVGSVAGACAVMRSQTAAAVSAEEINRPGPSPATSSAREGTSADVPGAPARPDVPSAPEPSISPSTSAVVRAPLSMPVTAGAALRSFQGRRGTNGAPIVE